MIVSGQAASFTGAVDVRRTPSAPYHGDPPPWTLAGAAAASYQPAPGPLAALAARRDVAHRVLGQRGDREARVDAEVRRHRRAVADEQVLVAEHAWRASRHAVRGIAPITAPPRMCAVDGMLATASMHRLCAIPPVRSASHSRDRVGDRDERRVRAAPGPARCVSRTLPPKPPAARERDRVVERLHHEQDHRPPRPPARDQRAREAPGWRTAAPSSFSGRVTRVPSPVSSVNSGRSHVARVAVGDGLDVRVRVGVDRAR